MPDFTPGDMLLQFGRGSRGLQSLRADAFRMEMVQAELQALQAEERLDTFGVTLKRCSVSSTSPSEVAEFETVGELFAVYSPIWQFAIDWTAPLANAEGHAAHLKERYYAWRSDVAAWMTRIWLGDMCQRIPLSCFAQAQTLTACIEHFVQTGGGRYPGISWISDTESAWHFYVHPEDEYPNRHESHVRPASTLSPPELEVQRQLGQVSFRLDPAIESRPLTNGSGILFKAGLGAEVVPFNAETTARACDQLNGIDWERATCYISIFQEDSKYSPLLGYIAMVGHPLGVLLELVVPHSQSEDHYCAFSPVADAQSEQMVRIWVGMHYRRVPVQRLLQPAQAIELVQTWLSQPRLHSALFPWPGESDTWCARLSPEDDIYDPLEPATRRTSQTSIPSNELYERLIASYTSAGLPTSAIRFRASN